MKRSPRVRLSATMKRSSLCLSILSLALLLLGSPALATTPIAVDMYQDMESGNNGDVLTSSIMNASCHGGQSWYPYSGTMWVSTAYHHDLPGPVICGGVTYNGTGGSRCWQFSNTYAMNDVKCSCGGTEVSEACYYTTLTTLTYQVGYDVFNMWGGTSFQCMQTLQGPVLHLHSKTYNNYGTNFDPITVPATPGKTYWTSINYDGSTGQMVLAVFDPDNSYAQVGSALWVVSTVGDNQSLLDVGRVDNHGNQTNDLTYGYFDQILVDTTNAAFPLLPSGANDTTAPSAPPAVRDGTGADQSICLFTTQLSANWDPAVDNESGIKGYQYAIGTTQGGTNVVNWTTVKNLRGVTKTGLSLTTGQTYYFSVKAINGVGLTGPAANSNGQTVGTDTTAPSAPGAVRDTYWFYNYQPDIDETPWTYQLASNWDRASDNESGISCYQYAFGTTPGGTDTQNWVTLPANYLMDKYGIAMNGSDTSVTLVQGTRYYCTVRAVNNAGLTGPATNSNGVICPNQSDTTPPSAPPAVRDGTGSTETSTTTSTTQLSANWDNSTDNESGISGYYYAIGTTVGGSNIVGDTRVSYNSPVSSITRTGLSLTVGQTYYFRIKAINGVNGNGLTGAATNSSGQTVVSGTDSTPPSAPPAVRDGTGADISTTVSTTQLSANWDASTDNESGISGYQYAIGTSAGGTQTVNFTSLGNVTTVTKTGLTLSVGQTYYFSVKAVNGAGLTGSATNSNGQTVVTDSTPPSAPPAVRDGTGADISTTSSTTQLSANWDASTDNESGISGYQYAIGTSAGGTQTVNFTSLGDVTTVTKTGLTLTVGQTYFFSVKAVNGAGLTGSATNSNGQTVVDVTPPSAPANVRDGTGADISTTSSTTQLSANWDAATDAESGISGYQYAIGTSAGGTQTVNWTSLGNVTTVTKTGLTLSVGQTYYFSVQAVNGAGLTGSATNSNGQTVVSSGGSVTYFQDNFESWTVHGGAWSSVSGESSTQTLNTSTDYAKAGAKSLKITDTDTTASYCACLVKTFSPVITTDIYARFYIFVPTGFSSTNSGCVRRALRILCGNNRGQISFCPTYTVMEEVGAWGAAQGPALSENAWHCIEMHIAPPSASTALQFWIDGTSAGTLTANFSTSTSFDTVQLGDVSTSGTNGTGTFYVDEFVVSNSYIGTGITAPVTYFSDTFDSWSVHGGAWSSVSGESSSHTLNTSTDFAKAGTKSVKITDTDTVGTSGACLVKNFSPTISGDIYVRFYVYLPTGYASTNLGGTRRVLRRWCQSNRGQISLIGDQPDMEEVGAWGNAPWPTALSESAWHCIELHMTAPAATTALEFWVDGVRNSAGLTANFGASSTWDHIELGDVILATGTANGTGTFYMDEVVISNSYNGPLP